MGGIDFVVANAGVAAYGTVRQADEASFERVLDINLNGVFRTLKYATPHLERSRGHAMVVASAISFTPIAGLASYAASKAGVEMLALAYRQEVAHLGITVGLVHPSWIDTDLVRGAEADLPSFQGLRARLPYPGNVTTSVDRAAEAIVNGLVRRRSRVYVPRAVVVANWAKAALNSPAAWPWMRRFAAQVTPTLEREVAALGRHDQLVPGSRKPLGLKLAAQRRSDRTRCSIAPRHTACADDRLPLRNSHNEVIVLYNEVMAVEIGPGTALNAEPHPVPPADL